MKLLLDQDMQRTIGGLAMAPARWRVPTVACVIVLLSLFAIYQQTFLSMVNIWWRSETFTHGFLIFPISVYLVWQQRKDLAKLTPAPDYWGLSLLLVLGLAWLMSNAADVLVIQQLCVIAMIPVSLWTLLGWRVVKRIAFPLGFLFFAVPIGEFLIPRMMVFTADFTVKMLQVSGIPVYREGTFFSIPSGDWSVVEGCSGLRYLIASITLGCLYAYLTFRSLFRRWLFILLAVFFPVIANGLRAYMIVMIAHLSGMKLALGVDHFIYGWIFFGLVMLLMFWIGSFWRDFEQVSSRPGLPVKTAELPRNRVFVLIALAAVAIASIWPARAVHIAKRLEARTGPVNLELPQPVQPWLEVPGVLTWEPYYQGPDVAKKAFYRAGSRNIGLYLLYYRSQHQGAELINSQNVLAPQKHRVWKVLDEVPVRVSLGGRQVTVLQGRLDSPGARFLVWRWNWLAGAYTSNEYWGKLLEAKARLLGVPQDAAAIVVVTQYDEQIKPARKALQDFIDQMLPAIERRLDEAATS